MGVVAAACPGDDRATNGGVRSGSRSSCDVVLQALLALHAAVKSPGKGGCTPTIACTTSSSSASHTTKPVKIARQHDMLNS